MSAKILSLGNTYFEIDCLNFPVDKVVVNREIAGEKYVVYSGGSALNCTRICKALGFSTFFVGKIGDDITGRMATQMLEDEGIGFYPIISSEHQTNLALNFVSDTDGQLITIAGNASQDLEASELDEKLNELLPQVDYLYLGGIFKLKKLLPSLWEIVATAKKNSSKIVLDHNRLTNKTTEEEKSIMKKVIPVVDYYLPSKDELMDLYGGDSLDDTVKILTNERKGVSVIKDAENGAIGIRDGKIERVPAFQVPIHNTVGAGDSFNAGFLRAVEDGLDFSESIRFANATAALKISKEELPTYEEVKNLCQKS